MLTTIGPAAVKRFTREPIRGGKGVLPAAGMSLRGLLEAVCKPCTFDALACVQENVERIGILAVGGRGSGCKHSEILQVVRL